MGLVHRLDTECRAVPFGLQGWTLLLWLSNFQPQRHPCGPDDMAGQIWHAGLSIGMESLEQNTVTSHPTVKFLPPWAVGSWVISLTPVFYSKE